MLNSSGMNCTTISRMPGTNRMTWHDLEKNGLPPYTHAVVNLAGQNVLDPTRRWTAGFSQNVWNSRINTTTAIVNAITKANVKPKCFINISGVSLYPPSNNKTYTEEDQGEDFDYMSKLCLAWEKAATMPENIECRVVKIRTGVVLGREGGMIQSIIVPFFMGVGGNIADGKQYLPWIHIIDLCNLIKFAINNENVTGVLNAVSPNNLTNAEFTKAFAKSMKRPAVIPMPEIAVKIIFGKERSVLLTSGAKITPKRTLDYGFKYYYSDITEACKDVSKLF